MRIVSWNWFWYVLVGFIMGGGAVYLCTVMKQKSIRMVWHEWILTILSFIVFMFMGQTFIASFGEGEARAAWLTIVFMGLPIVIMAVLVLRSVRARFIAGN